MINIKKLSLPFLCLPLLYGCLIFEEPFYPYSINLRNACGYDIESIIPSRLQYNYKEYFPEAYLGADGIPVVNLKPREEVTLASRIARADYGRNADFWEKVFPANETFTISANNNSLVLNKQRIIELLKNNELNPKNDVPEWVIYDSSLCP
jgi:hypothetical protein